MLRLAGRLAILVALTVTAVDTGVRAQAPDQPSPTLPTPEAAPAEEAPAPGSREARLEERLRKMEAMNQQILGRLDAVTKANQELTRRLDARPASDGGKQGGSGAEGASARESQGEEGGSGSGGGSGRNASGTGAEGTGGRTSTRETGASTTADRKPRKRKVVVEAGDGLEFKSEDGEFKLVFHDLTQAELRSFSPLSNGPLNNTFFIPRQRWYFVGQVSRDVEFYTSINRGYGSLDLLDAFITLNFPESLSGGRDSETDGAGAQGTGGRTTVNKGREPNRKLRLRVGRTKTPYLYEYYEIAEGDLIAPERSLYAGNLAPNRQIGASILGDLLRGRLEYNLGLYNGPRRSFQDTNNAKDIFTFLNTRPFLHSERFPALKYLNLGGSFNAGFEQGDSQPVAFRTANDQTPSTAASTLSPTFLQFNNNVVENGQREQWSGHAVLYYKQLGLLGEYGGGFQDYGLRGRGYSTQVPFEGYMTQAFFFLTGEQITRRVNVVKPLRDFGYHDGKFGIGAVEVHARFSQLGLGREIFNAGLADPNLWTNNACATDVGFNWFLNYYTKIYFDWQHAEFGNPVSYGPGRFTRTTELFWLRFQLFF